MMECPNNRIDELDNKDEGKQAKKKSFFHVRLCHEKACLLTSNDPVKKIPHRFAQTLGFQLILDVVKLTTKIIQQR